MDGIRRGILGVQITLVGLLLGTLFGGVSPFDIVAVVLGVVGTVAVLTAVIGGDPGSN